MSKKEPRKTAIPGNGARFNIMQSLKDIDEKILGPNGIKDTGVNLNDNDFLDGFLEGFNDSENGEYRRKIWIITGLLTIVISIIITTYYIMFYYDDFDTNY